MGSIMNGGGIPLHPISTGIPAVSAAVTSADELEFARYFFGPHADSNQVGIIRGWNWLPADRELVDAAIGHLEGKPQLPHGEQLRWILNINEPGTQVRLTPNWMRTGDIKWINESLAHLLVAYHCPNCYTVEEGVAVINHAYREKASSLPGWQVIVMDMWTGKQYTWAYGRPHTMVV